MEKVCTRYWLWKLPCYIETSPNTNKTHGYLATCIKTYWFSPWNIKYLNRWNARLQTPMEEEAYLKAFKKYILLPKPLNCATFNTGFSWGKSPPTRIESMGLSTRINALLWNGKGKISYIFYVHCKFARRIWLLSQILSEYWNHTKRHTKSKCDII